MKVGSATSRVAAAQGGKLATFDWRVSTKMTKPWQDFSASNPRRRMKHRDRGMLSATLLLNVVECSRA